MDIPIIIVLLCCTSLTFASHDHSHTIPVEGYETELQDLGEHVEIPETPVKVIKITKTIAVKIPVPYPVKVIEKVPYPVHVNKPYPVPVPHIVKVPQPPTSHIPQGHEAIDVNTGAFQNQLSGHLYKVQENHPQEAPHNEQYEGHNNQDEGSYGITANGPANEEYYSNASPGNYNSGAPNDYHDEQNGQYSNQVIQNYVNSLNPHSSYGRPGNYH